MNGHSHQSACLDLGYCTSGERVLSVLSNINVASQLRSTALIDDIGGYLCIADDGCVLLAGADARTVSREGSINYMGVNHDSAMTFAGSSVIVP